MTAPLRAITYARVSTADQATDGTSLETQRQQTADFVNAKGWSHVEHISDQGVSGAKDSRPGLDRLMAACRAGEVDAVVVAKLDRFSRSMKHLVNAVGELDDLGVAFVSVAESIDSTTPTGRMMRSLLGTFAEFERERIVERMTDSHRRLVAQGYWRGGRPPYGYKLVPAPDGSSHTSLAINEDERNLLRRVADLIINDGHTAYSATKLLNAEGLKTRSGGRWEHTNLSGHLRQPHLTGTWVFNHQGEEISMSIPSIFSQDEFDAIRKATKGRPNPERRNRTYPLTGRGRCHLRCDCGSNYSGKHDSSKGISSYVCGRNPQEYGEDRCPHRPRSLRTEKIERATVHQLLPKLARDYLLGLAATHLDQTDHGDDTASRLRQLNRKLADLHAEKKTIVREMARSGDLDYLEDTIADIEAEEEVLRQQIAELERREQMHLQRSTVEDQLEQLADVAEERLANLTNEEMAAFFDLIDLDLVRVDSHRFEGTASIPVPADGGEVWKGSPYRSSQ